MVAFGIGTKAPQSRTSPSQILRSGPRNSIGTSSDAQVQHRLTQMGWKVRVVWECDLNTKAKVEETADRLQAMQLMIE
jgi:G:T-mismatch repair DNA endonuclease (very short patch repair protein)